MIRNRVGTLRPFRRFRHSEFGIPSDFVIRHSSSCSASSSSAKPVHRIEDEDEDEDDDENDDEEEGRSRRGRRKDVPDQLRFARWREQRLDAELRREETLPSAMPEPQAAVRSQTDDAIIILADSDPVRVRAESLHARRVWLRDGLVVEIPLPQ